MIPTSHPIAPLPQPGPSILMSLSGKAKAYGFRNFKKHSSFFSCMLFCCNILTHTCYYIILFISFITLISIHSYFIYFLT